MEANNWAWFYRGSDDSQALRDYEAWAEDERASGRRVRMWRKQIAEDLTAIVGRSYDKAGSK